MCSIRRLRSFLSASCITSALLFATGCSQTSIRTRVNWYAQAPTDQTANLEVLRHREDGVYIRVIDGHRLNPDDLGDREPIAVLPGPHTVTVMVRAEDYFSAGDFTFTAEPAHSYRLKSQLNGLKIDVTVLDVTDHTTAPMEVTAFTVATHAPQGPMSTFDAGH